MPVVAVINRKGGSGKSTLSTHLAAYCSHKGIPVMLGDVDRQQSTQTWLKLRRSQKLPELAPIVGWNVDASRVMRPPAGVAHVVLDTPGGLRGFDLARVVMFADAILMPVCNSVFDRESAAECYAELMTMPRVSSGRCVVGAVGMRLDARTKAAEVLKAWADAQKLPFVGVLRETQTYVKTVERGLTLFDMPADKVEADLAQWEPILHWLGPALQPAPHRNGVKPASAPVGAARSAPETVNKAAVPVLVKVAAPVQRPVVPAAVQRKPAVVPAAAMKTRPTVANRLARLFGLSRKGSAY